VHLHATSSPNFTKCDTQFTYFVPCRCLSATSSQHFLALGSKLIRLRLSRFNTRIMITRVDLKCFRGQRVGLLAQHDTITLHGYTIPRANADHHIMHSLCGMWYISSARFATTCQKSSPPYTTTDTPTKWVATDARTLPTGSNTRSHVSPNGARTIRSEIGKGSHDAV
jgi:hypothetical protein